MTHQKNDLCAQWRLRSAWASAQSDPSSLYTLWVVKDPNFLRWSESLLGTQVIVAFAVLGFIYSKWAATWQNQQSECAHSEDSDQPGHPPSQIRVFAVRMKKTWVLSYPLSAQRRLWSDWVDAQADLSLRWAHMPFCCFCHEVAQIVTQVYIHINRNISFP